MVEKGYCPVCGLYREITPVVANGGDNLAPHKAANNNAVFCVGSGKKPIEPAEVMTGLGLGVVVTTTDIRAIVEFFQIYPNALKVIDPDSCEAVYLYEQKIIGVFSRDCLQVVIAP